MNTAIERRMRRLEKAVMPTKRKLVEFARTLADGRQVVMHSRVTIEQARGEGADAFEARVKQTLGGSADDGLMLIELVGLKPRGVPILIPGGRVVVVPPKLVSGDEVPPVPA